jgi:hypothetical protein
MQDEQTMARRREVLNALLDVTEQHRLPLPMHINFDSYDGVNLRLEANDRDGVHRWAEALNNGEVTEDHLTGDGHRPFYSVRSLLNRHESPTWLGLSQVYIWSACNTSEAGEPA